MWPSKRWGIAQLQNWDAQSYLLWYALIQELRAALFYKELLTSALKHHYGTERVATGTSMCLKGLTQGMNRLYSSLLHFLFIDLSSDCMLWNNDHKISQLTTETKTNEATLRLDNIGFCQCFITFHLHTWNWCETEQVGVIMEWALILEIPSLSSSFPELTKFYAEHRSIVCAIQEVGGSSGSRQSEYIYLNEFWETVMRVRSGFPQGFDQKNWWGWGHMLNLCWLKLWAWLTHGQMLIQFLTDL